MRPAFASTLAVLTFLAALSGCKKAESPAPASPAPTKAETNQAEASPAAAPASEAPKITGDPVALVVKWLTGNRYVYRMDLRQESTNTVPGMPNTIRQDVSIGITYVLSVLNQTPDGGHELLVEFPATEMAIRMAGQVIMNFNSKDNGAQEAHNPFAGPFRKMVASKVRLLADSSGKVDQVIDYKPWIDSITAGANSQVASIFTQHFTESFLRQIAGFETGLPGKPVRQGETWPFKIEMPASSLGKINVDSTVLFKGWDQRDGHRCALLDFSGTLSSVPGQEAGPMGTLSIEGGKVAGWSYFDPELGALIESSQTQSMHLKGQLSGTPGTPGGLSYSVELGQSVTVKLLELGKVAPAIVGTNTAAALSTPSSR